MRDSIKLALGIAEGIILAVSVTSQAATVGIEITLQDGRVKTHRVDNEIDIIGKEFVGRDENNLPLYKTTWPDYGVGYKSIKIPNGIAKLRTVFIRDHEIDRHSGIRELEELLLPNDSWRLGVQIIGTQIKTLAIPDGLDLLYLFISNTPFESLLLGKEPTPLQSIEFWGLTSESFRLPEGLRKLERIDFRDCVALKDVYFGWDTASSWRCGGVKINTGGSPIERVHVSSQLGRSIRFERDNWHNNEVPKMVPLPGVHVSKQGNVMEVRWGWGLRLYASERPDGDWKYIGGSQLSPMRMPAVLEGKMFFDSRL